MSYWGRRAAKTQANLTEKTIRQTEKQLAKYYSDCMEDVVERFVETYTHVLEAAGDGKEPTPADLYKLDTYWRMQGELQQKLQKLGNKQMVLFGKEFVAEYRDIYESIALGAGDAFGTANMDLAQQAIQSIWCADGKSWSDRVWKNTEKLAETLNEELVQCLVTGKKTSELKKRLQQRFSVSYSNADMIARTELSHIQTVAAQQRYKDYGIKKVEILADKDERRCPTCGKLHGKQLLITDVMPVPVHPNCRCSIIPVIED